MSEVSPRAVYRDFIDRLVAETSLVTTRRAPERFASLSTEVQSSIEEVRREERIAAIHDVLEQLSWLIDMWDVSLVLDGSALPVDESGMGLHGDFIGRLEGWPWPSKQ